MSRRRNRPSQTPVITAVEGFSHDGRGIARIDGKATFIQGALPDEKVTFQYLRKKKNFDEGKLIAVETASSHRVDPRCEHYWMCGGCSLQHLDEKVQIEYKQDLFLDLLRRTGNVQPQTILVPLVSDRWHYRNKARLSVRYVEKKESTLVGFREKNNPRFIADIKNCSILNAKIDAQLIPLRQLISSFTDPKIIAQIEVAAGDKEVALIFRNLSPLAISDEQKLREFADQSGFKIYLQPGGEESVSLFYPESTHEFLTYHLPEQAISFQFHPTDFTQVNAGLNRLMVKRALELLALEHTDQVLDLYCGLGNFTLPIAKYCSHVVGVEGSERMVNRARMNAQNNQLDNTEFFAANLDDEKEFTKFAHYKFNKLLLDPPRTGALAIVKQMDKINPKQIVYISCNPATLARDADILVNQQGYSLISAGVMDMFTHTAHVESIALFEKK